MKVLQVIPSISLVHGGPSRAIRLIESVLQARGVDVLTATSNDDGPRLRLQVQLAKPVTDGTSTRIYFRKRLEFYTVLSGMTTWLWRNVRRFDVVHVHALFSFASTVAAAIALARGVPYIIRPLGTLSSYGISTRRPWLKRISLPLIERPLLLRAAAVHCTSEAEAVEVRALAPEAKVTTISLAVPGETPQTASSATAFFPELPGRTAVLYLSRIDRKKNLESLLSAWSTLVSRHRSALLVIAGDGPADYVAELKAKCVKYGIGESTRWLGHVDGEAKRALFTQSDIFVLPSYSENFGIAAVEAMAAGLPSVLSRGVAVSRELAEYGAGVVCAPDPESIADAIACLLADVRLRTRCGAAAARLVAERFSPQALGDQLVALYSRVGRQPEYPR